MMTTKELPEARWPKSLMKDRKKLNGDQKSLKRKETGEEDDVDFKRQLVQWLKENRLKLTSLNEMYFPSASNLDNSNATDEVKGEVPIGNYGIK